MEMSFIIRFAHFSPHIKPTGKPALYTVTANEFVHAEFNTISFMGLFIYDSLLMVRSELHISHLCVYTR